MKKFNLLAVILLILSALFGVVDRALADSTILITPTNMNDWSFHQFSPTGTGELTEGPGTPPIGPGTARLSVNSNGGMSLYSAGYPDTRLDLITTIQYSSYRASFDAGNNRTIALQLEMDYNLNDAGSSFQGWLVYEPYKTPGASGTILEDTWYTWNPLAGEWYGTRAPGSTLCPQSDPCTIAEILAAYPNAGVRHNGGVRLVAGDFWGLAFTGYVDALTIGVNGTNTTHDFEYALPCSTDCYVNASTGNDAYSGSSPDFPKQTIQAAIDQVSAGGSVHVYPGTYAESPLISKSLTLQSTGGRDTTEIVLQEASSNYLDALTITAGTVTLDGLTITGYDAVDAGLASSNVVLQSGLTAITITNNRFKVGQAGSGTNGDDGIGLLNYYSESSLTPDLTVNGNLFVPVSEQGHRAFYINPGVTSFAFSQNEISGLFEAASITQAQNGLVEGNIVQGAGDPGSRSGGLGAWGYPDPQVWGHTTFRANEISGTSRAIAIYEAEDILVENNALDGNETGLWIGSTPSSLPFDPTAITVVHNSLAGSDTYGMENTTTVNMTAEANWWNHASGPTHSSHPDGSGDPVSDLADFDPWLCSGTDTSPETGFQPDTSLVCGGSAPSTSLDSTPADPSTSGNAAFSFSASDDFTPAGGLSFECQLDGGGWEACSAPKAYTGLADGSHTFEVRAVDLAGIPDPSPESFTWLVDTTAPEISNVLASPNPVAAGGDLTLTADLSDGGSGVAGAQYSLDGGLTWLPMDPADGAYDEANEGATITFPVSTTGGTYTVCVQAVDATGTTAPATCITFTVNEPPGAISAGGPYTGDEGWDVSLSGSASDPENDPLTFAWSYALGPGTDTGTSCSFSDASAADTAINCTDNGLFTLTLTAGDGVNPTISASTTMFLGNLEPTLNIHSPTEGQSFRQGDTVAVTARVREVADNDSLTCNLDWGDGTADEGTIESGYCNASHAYAAPGDYTLTITVTDDDNGSNSQTVGITVFNDPPSIDAGGPYSGAEGQNIDLLGLASDAEGDNLAISWSYAADPGADPGAACTFADPNALDTSLSCTGGGTFTLTLTVADGVNPAVSDTAALTVSDAAPVADAGGPYTGDEGQLINIAGTASDPGADVLAYTWTYAAGADVDPGTTCTFGNPASPETTFSCNDDGTFTLTFTADDGLNPPVSDSASVVLDNRPPLVTLGDLTGGRSFQVGDQILMSAAIDDPGSNDAKVCQVNWGDGAVTDGTVAAGTCTATHAFTAPGEYLLTVDAYDDDGGSGSDSTTLSIPGGWQGPVFLPLMSRDWNSGQ